jgi:hypothetical protein
LHRGDQSSEEVELTGAEPALESTGPEESSAGTGLPQAVCPDGSPQAVRGEPASAPPLAPGESALDGGNLTEITDLEDNDLERTDAADDASQSEEGSAP